MKESITEYSESLYNSLSDPFFLEVMKGLAKCCVEIATLTYLTKKLSGDSEYYLGSKLPGLFLGWYCSFTYFEYTYGEHSVDVAGYTATDEYAYHTLIGPLSNPIPNAIHWS